MQTYELRDNKGNLVARGTNSFCRVRLFQRIGKATIPKGWTLTPYGN